MFDLKASRLWRALALRAAKPAITVLVAVIELLRRSRARNIRGASGSPGPDSSGEFQGAVRGFRRARSQAATAKAKRRTPAWAFAAALTIIFLGAFATPGIASATLVTAVTVLAGNNQSTAISTTFASALAVLVTDEGGPVSGASVTFTAPGGGASGTFSNSSNTITVLSDETGYASSGALTANTTAGGPFTVAVSTPGAPGVNFSETNLGASPTVTSISPTSGPTSGGTSVTITGTGFIGVTGVTIGGTSATSITVVNATTITAVTPAGSAGSHSVLVTTPSGTNSFNLLYTYVPAPTVTSISPTSGTTAGGTSVTITGTNFTAATAVTIGGTAATSFTVVSPTSITASTPTGSAGSASVLVTTVGGTNSANILYTYVAPPTVTSVSPSSGRASGGISVTINGTGFSTTAANNTVMFGTTNATNVSVIGTQTVIATAPAGSGAVDVTVTTTTGGTSATSPSDQFTYLPPLPTVTAISPSGGLTTGGTSVTLTGTDFTGASSVVIGNAAATNVTVVSPTSITATTPAGVGTKAVVVTTPSGTSAPGVTYTYTLPLPTVTSISPSIGATAGGTSVTITGTGFTGLANLTIGGQLASSVVVVGDTSITAITPAGSSGPASVLVTSPGGTNVANSLYTYVPPVPTVTAISPSFGPAEGGQSVTITGTGFTGATAVSITATPVTSFTVVNATTITAVTPAGTAGTSGEVSVTTPGGTGYGGSYAYVGPPTVSAITANTGPTAGGQTVNITGTNLDGATSVTIGGVAATSFTVLGSGFITAVTPAGTAGAASVVVTTPGGASSANALYTYERAPTVSAISPSSGSISGGVSVTITGTNFTGATGVTIGGAPAFSVTVVSPTSITATIPQGAAGSASVLVTTPGGTNHANRLYTYLAAPTVTAISPSFGPAEGGQSVTITGAGFTGATAVAIAATPVTSFTVVNATTITAVTPAGTAGTSGEVAVTTPGGTGYGGSYAYVGPPTVSAITANTGPTAGGQTVNITGTNLDGATSVTIRGVAATSFTVLNSGLITAVTPAGTAGAASVVVTTPGGASSANALYTYERAPTVSAISPSSGSISGGASVTITGTNFTGATGVTIGGAPATSVVVVSPTSITATIPQGSAGSASVLVTTPGGTNHANRLYTYVGAPTVTGVSPSSGSPAGGTTVTITGTGFDGATAVTIGGATATGFTVVSARSITATTPAGAAGPASVLVTTPGGTNSANTLFTYASTPTVTEISPSTGATAGGTAVTITGTNFTGATAVTIRGVAATGVTVISSTSITAMTPAGDPGLASVLVTTPGGTNSANTLFTYLNPLATTQAVAATTLTAGVAATAFTPVTASGGFGTITYALSGGTLPTGLTFSTTTGQITGTPTALLATTTFTVTATDRTTPTSQSSSKTFALTVIQPPIAIAPASLAAPTQAVAYSQTLSASGGTGPYAFTLASGGLPTGLTLSSAGVISGTPTVSGAFNITVKATETADSALFGHASYTLVVAGPPPPTATAVAVTVAIAASSTGQAINLASDVAYASGIVIITPPRHGTAVVDGFVVTYTPNAGYYGPDSFTYGAVPLDNNPASRSNTHARRAASASATVSITIPPPTVIMGAARLAAGQQGVAYSQTVSASGGTAPYAYAVAAGALPGGLSLNASTGAITGTPTAKGRFSFTVKGTDASTGTGPFSATGAYSIVIAASPPNLGAPLQATVLQGRLLTINLSATATNGPFTAGSIVSVSPVRSATVSMVASGSGPNAAYTMNFTSNGTFSGAVVVTYSLANAYESGTNTVTVTVQARPDPSKNPDVIGIVNGEYQSALRLGQAQLDNFNDHLLGLHDGSGARQDVGGVGFHNGMNFRMGDNDVTDPFAARDHDLMYGHAGFSPPPAFGAQSIKPNQQGSARQASMPAAAARAHTSGFGDQADASNSQTPDGKTAPPPAGPNSAAASDPSGPPRSALDNPVDRVTLWTAGAVDFGLHTTPTTHVGLHFQTDGITVGADYVASNSLTLGFGFGYGQDVTKFGQDGGYTNARDYAGAVYGDWRVTKVNFVDFVVGYSNLDLASRRFDPTVQMNAYGDRTGGEAFGSLTLGWDFRSMDWKMSAYTRLNGMSGALNPFTETGAGAYDLSFARQSVNALNGVIGLHGDLPLTFYTDAVTPRFTLEYQRDFAGADSASLAYADWVGGPKYAISTLDTSRNHLSAGLGADVVKGLWSFSFDFKSEFTRGQTAGHELQAKAATRF